MERLVIRIDDISANTDFVALKEMCDYARDEFGASFLYGITVLSGESEIGAVYPDPPFKNRDKQFFYALKKSMSLPELTDGEIASHGLVHMDHSKLSQDAQEISILGSCSYLGTKKFIAPFGRFNAITEIICQQNGIELICEGWKSLESLTFDPSFKKWYFHPWRFTVQSFKDALNACRTAV